MAARAQITLTIPRNARGSRNFAREIKTRQRLLGKEFQKQLLKVLKKNAPGTGRNLGSSFLLKTRTTKNSVSLFIESKHPGAGPLEFGVKPGTRPPVARMIQWVKRKNLKARGGRKFKNREAEARWIAFAVSRSIQKKGIKAREYMQKSIDDTMTKIRGKLKGKIFRFIQKGKR